jgi:uncharacterized membrane protein HdeD (DUF308 family)
MADVIEAPWQDWWALALRGTLAIVAGLIALFFPGVTLTAFILLFTAYLLVDGAFALIAGFRATRRHERSWPLFLEGVADIPAGLIAFLLAEDRPPAAGLSGRVLGHGQRGFPDRSLSSR